MQGVKVKEIKISPQPVTKTFLSDRIDDLDARTSAAVVEALTEAGLLDASGYLLADPRCCSSSSAHNLSGWLLLLSCLSTLLHVLACPGLVSHAIVLVRASSCGNLPRSCLAAPCNFDIVLILFYSFDVILYFYHECSMYP